MMYSMLILKGSLSLYDVFIVDLKGSLSLYDVFNVVDLKGSLSLYDVFNVDLKGSLSLYVYSLLILKVHYLCMMSLHC